MFKAIARTAPSLIDLLLLTIGVIVLSSMFGISLFGGDALNSRIELPTSNFSATALELAILLYTADNYPAVLFSTIDCKETACSPTVAAAFFVAFIWVGFVMILSVTVAVIFEVYKKQHGILILEEKVSQRQALSAAFLLLDVSADGRLNVTEFSSLMKHVYPNASSSVVSLAFNIVDKDSSDSVDYNEFVDCCDVLRRKLQATPVSDRFLFLSWQSRRVSRMVNSSPFTVLGSAVISLYVVFLVVASAIDLAQSSVEAIDTAFLVYFTFEAAFMVVGLSLEGYWTDAWNRLDIFVLVLCFFSLILQAIIGTDTENLAVIRVLRLLRLVRLMRVARAVNLATQSTQKARVLIRTFEHFGRILTPLVLVLLIFMYSCAILGMETLKTYLSRHHSESFEGCAPFCPSFDSMPTAWLTLFQIFLGTNFASVLHEAIRNSGDFWWPTMYFLSFTLVAHVFMLALIGALVFEVYAVEMERMASQNAQPDKIAVLTTIKEVAPERAVPATTQQVEAPSEMRASKNLVLTAEACSKVNVLSSSVKAMFNRFDTDGTGTIDAWELRDLMHALLSEDQETSDEELDECLKALDQDQSSMIDFHEFLPWWRKFGIGLVFKKHDRDQTGSIDGSELGPLMADLGMDLNERELEYALKILDANGDGSIAFDEYLRWFELYDVRTEFDKYDNDGSGTISRKEFFRLTANHGISLTRKELDKVFNALDGDHSGHISFVEFQPWWEQVRESAKSLVLSTSSWEETVFLERRDNTYKARLAEKALERMREAVLAVAEEINAGGAITGDELVERLLLNSEEDQACRTRFASTNLETPEPSPVVKAGSKAAAAASAAFAGAKPGEISHGSSSSTIFSTTEENGNYRRPGKRGVGWVLENSEGRGLGCGNQKSVDPARARIAWGKLRGALQVLKGTRKTSLPLPGPP